MRRRSGMALTLALAVGLAAIAPWQQTAASGLASRLVYSTKFQHGLSGWRTSGSGGSWTATDGMLIYSEPGHDLAAGSQTVAPVKLTTLGAFAVQARMQFNGSSSSAGAGFGIVVRTWPGTYPGANNYGGILFGAWEPAPSNGQPFVGIGYDHGVYGAETVREFGENTEYNAGNSWHTFKLVVRGNQYSATVDGEQVATGTSNAFLNGPSVGLYSEQASITVQSFKVTALQ